MPELLIIADDFTGALDTGVQFAKRGIQTFFSLKGDSALFADPVTQVLVVDTESRHMEPKEAYRTVFEIVRRAKQSGVRHIYKKTDSTLRGNIGSELTAVLDAFNADTLAFVPAFPMTGRVTVNGFQYVDGEPLHKTVYACDPLNPVKCSYIPDIIGEQTNINTVVVGKQELYELVDKGLDKKRICVFDCEKDEEMIAIGHALKKADQLNISAGCAGFAAYLPELLGMDRNCDSSGSFVKRHNEGVLVICGSINELSLRQLKFGEKHDFCCITLNPEEKLTENYFDRPGGMGLIDKINKYLSSKKKLIIKAMEDKAEMEQVLLYSRNIGLTMKDIPLQVARNMGELVKKVLEFNCIGTLVVFGGDTAVSVIKALGCDGIVPLEEIIPGVVASRVIGADKALLLITKAGGFGSENVLQEIEEYLNLHSLRDDSGTQAKKKP